MEKRNTKQKNLIIEFLMKDETHPTAEELYNKITANNHRISLATIYRNLKEMSEEKKILQFEINNESHFDYKAFDHIHTVCTVCGKIEDIFLEEKEEKIFQNFISNLNLDNFSLEQSKLFLYGKCKNCGGKNGI